LKGACADILEAARHQGRDKAPILKMSSRPQAERRVWDSVAELVCRVTGATEQLKAHIEELAASYEMQEVVRWYLSDNSSIRSRSRRLKTT
jgi:septal ring factor EnvC (AmiA/AmiB activator)